jgi:hypothetical protein
MKQVRYGIYVPDHGYVYAGDLYGTLRFTDDISKASLGKAYVDKAEAASACDQVMRKKTYPIVQVVTYEVTVTAVIEEFQTKEQRKRLRKVEHSDMIAEYQQLKAMYDALSPKEVEKLSQKKWAYYVSLKDRLVALDIL